VVRANQDKGELEAKIDQVDLSILRIRPNR